MFVLRRGLRTTLKPLHLLRNTSTTPTTKPAAATLSTTSRTPAALSAMIKSVLGTAAGQPTMPQELVFVTGNANKLREVQAILGSAVPSLTNRALDLPEMQGTIEEITLDKARRAAAEIGGPVIVEDTCLCFNALKGLPGPYVKWFMKELGHDGLNNMLAAYEDKSAQAVCTFAYCAGPGSDAVLFEGRTDGKIVPARGPKVFGWDAVFEYEGQTYAEMDKEEKNKISHRGKALAKLKAWLAENHR